MADFSEFNDFGLDPRGDTPIGSTWGIGNTATNPDDPLNDWASNLSKDDLAKFLQDPQAHAQDMAARGIPPPDQAAIDRMHAHNDAMGTPSRSTRFDTAPASPLDQPIRTNRDGTIAGNITDQAPQQYAGAKRGDRGLVMGASPFPGGASTPEGTPTTPYQPPGQVYIPGQGQVTRPTPQSSWPTPPSPAGTGTATPPPKPAPAQAAPPVAAAPAPSPVASAINPLDPDKDKDTETEKDKKSDSVDLNTPEGKKRAVDAISDLGKAMQGVKGPEPLKPPSGFAPSPHSHTAAGAAQLGNLLGLVQGGQVPASAMPLLRLLGR